MEPENKNLTASQSLDIITRMIHQARGNVHQNRFHFLLWGAVVAVANIGMFVLMRMQYSMPYVIWLITIPAWLTSLYYGFKQGRKERVITYIDRTTMWLWISFGVSIFTLVFFGNTINWNLNPVILLMCAGPTLVSGVLLRFRPLIFGGISFWFFAIVCFLVDYEYRFLIGAIAVITGFFIPGYMLKNKADEHV